jgi:hypothetical protein
MGAFNWEGKISPSYKCIDAAYACICANMGFPMLACQIPYDDMTPVQAAVGVVQKVCTYRSVYSLCIFSSSGDQNAIV